MKKLRCTSCGAELKVEDNKDYAVCEHCGSKYKLNEDLNINIKIDDNMKDVINKGMEHSKKISKFMLIPFCIIFVMVICGFIFSFVDMSKTREEAKERREEIEEKTNEAKEKIDEESAKHSFNFQFSTAAGTDYGNQLGYTLDDIIESNKTHDRKVTLIFNGESTTDEERIIEIKHSLGSWDKYEVVVNYDDDGYVNEIKVDSIA